MKTTWTIIPAAVFGLALLSEPMMLIPGSYFSGIGEAELSLLAEATGRSLSEVRDDVKRGRIGEELENVVDGSEFLFKVRREGHYQVSSPGNSLYLDVSYLEPGTSFLQATDGGEENQWRMHLQPGMLVYVEVAGAERDRGSFEITDPLAGADISGDLKEVFAAGWEQWEFNPLALEQIEAGEPVFGHINPGRAHYYLLEASSEIPFRINMDSDEMDPYLEVWEVGSAGILNTHTNDDGGDGNNSMLRFRAHPNASHVIIKARGYSESTEGAFELRVRQPEPRSAGWTIQEVAEEEGLDVRGLRQGTLGARMQGFLSAGQEAFYVFPNATGEIDIDLVSDDFDTYVEAWTVDTQGGFFSDEDTDDDGGGDQNSRVSMDVGSHSVLLVKVRGFSESNSGRYELFVR